MIITTPTGSMTLVKRQATVGTVHNEEDDLVDVDVKDKHYWKLKYKQEKLLRKECQRQIEELNKTVQDLFDMLDDQIEESHAETMRDLQRIQDAINTRNSESVAQEEPRRKPGEFHTGYRLTVAKNQKPSLTRLDGRGDSLTRDIYDGVELDISPGHGFAIRPHRKG